MSALFFMVISLARAEYRAFELVITNSTTGQERTLISTLDPLQYRYYYPVRLEEQVKYNATWMCRGNTSHFQQICPRPETDQPANSGPTPPTAP